MDLTQIKQKTIIKNTHIYPLIDQLVDTLYTDEINNLINSKCQSIDDRRVFLMFLVMYFYTNLSIPTEIKEQYDVKNELKLFLTDIIKNPNKRHKCIELYTFFENSMRILI
jgi:hypothetical protein